MSERIAVFLALSDQMMDDVTRFNFCVVGLCFGLPTHVVTCGNKYVNNSSEMVNILSLSPSSLVGRNVLGHHIALWSFLLHVTRAESPD